MKDQMENYKKIAQVKMEILKKDHKIQILKMERERSVMGTDEDIEKKMEETIRREVAKKVGNGQSMGGKVEKRSKMWSVLNSRNGEV